MSLRDVKNKRLQNKRDAKCDAKGSFNNASQIRLILLGLRILVFYPLAFVAAEET